jgi:predicted nuclease with RNAse H fold
VHLHVGRVVPHGLDGFAQLHRRGVQLARPALDGVRLVEADALDGVLLGLGCHGVLQG